MRANQASNCARLSHRLPPTQFTVPPRPDPTVGLALGGVNWLLRVLNCKVTALTIQLPMTISIIKDQTHTNVSCKCGGHVEVPHLLPPQLLLLLRLLLLLVYSHL